MNQWCANFFGENEKIAYPDLFLLKSPKRCIKLFSCVGDILSDSCMDSSTMFIVAKILNRRSMGIEVS